MNRSDDNTIRDFGRQWSAWRDNDGYYASPELFEDMVGSLVDASQLEGKTVAEIGSGTGRIVDMLLDAGAGEVTAVEPSEAIDVLKTNTAGRADRIHYIHGTAADLKDDDHFDWIFSIGVIHHIADPGPTLAKCRQCLKPAGRIVLWLYGHEGNELYLALMRPLRAVTKRLPHRVLVPLSWILGWLL
ncbi:MAG: class I SAM-dependent methyltransferase, partial [Alphaproteobacteria bacterium]